ncbi:NUDIX hydrolase [Candidatus Woesearchaeota archaeon]|nr:NUDIX hydrolase [Candidatus Woesearchaeota archaeon]
MYNDTRPKPTVVCSAFIEKDGKYLFVYDPRFRVWRVPGGRVEYGEKLEDTLRREMKEELQLDITEPTFMGFGQDMQYKHSKGHETCRLLMFFHASITGEPVLDPHEASQSRWVTLEEMRQEEEKEGALADFFERRPDAQ